MRLKFAWIPSFGMAQMYQLGLKISSIIADKGVYVVRTNFGGIRVSVKGWSSTIFGIYKKPYAASCFVGGGSGIRFPCECSPRNLWAPARCNFSIPTLVSCSVVQCFSVHRRNGKGAPAAEAI